MLSNWISKLDSEFINQTDASEPTEVEQTLAFHSQDDVPVIVEPVMKDRQIPLSNFSDTTFPQADRWVSIPGPFFFTVPLAANTNPVLIKPFHRSGGDVIDTVCFLQTTAGSTFSPWVLQAWINYRLVRWRKIHYKIEMEAQPASYGLLFAMILPWELQQTPIWGTSVNELDVLSLMSYNPTVWPCNEQKTVELSAPFTSMFQWLYTDPYQIQQDFVPPSGSYIETEYDTVFAHMPTLIIGNLTALNEVFSMTTAPLVYRVFFRFEGLEFNMPINIDWVPAPPEQEPLHGDSCMQSAAQPSDETLDVFYTYFNRILGQMYPEVQLNTTTPEDRRALYSASVNLANANEPYMNLLKHISSELAGIKDEIADIKLRLGIDENVFEYEPRPLIDPDAIHGDSCMADQGDPHSFAPILNHPAALAGAVTLGTCMLGAALAIPYYQYATSQANTISVGQVRSTGELARQVKTATQSIVDTSISEINRNASKANVNPFPADFQVGWTGQVDHSLPFGVDLPTDPREYGGSETDIVSLCKKPGILLGSSLNAAHPRIAFQVYWARPQQNDTLTNTFQYRINYFSYISQFFRYWRGTFKLKIQFAGCSMVTARVRISLNYLGDLSAVYSSSSTTYIQPLLPFQDVTIKGYTEYCVSIPFIFPYDWAPTYPDPSDNYIMTLSPILRLDLLNIQTTGDVTPNIPTVIWFAADDDLQFRFPNPIIGPPPVEQEPIHGESCMWSEFEQKFPPFTGTQTSTYTRKQEVPVTNLMELISRWSQYAYFGGDTGGAILTPDAPYNPFASGGTPGYKSSYLASIAQLYAWFSGDMEFSVFTRKISSVTSTPVIISSTEGDLLVIGWGSRFNDYGDYGAVDPSLPDTGIMFMDCDKWSNARIGVPFMSNFAASPTGWYNRLYNREQNTQMPIYLDQQSVYCNLMTYQISLRTSIDRVYYRPGKSYQLMGLLPLPNFAYWMINPASSIGVSSAKVYEMSKLHKTLGKPIFQDRNYCANLLRNHEFDQSVTAKHRMKIRRLPKGNQTKSLNVQRSLPVYPNPYVGGKDKDSRK